MTRRWTFMVACAVAALVLAACSSSSSHTSSASKSSGTRAPIKVGVICSCSGPFGSQIGAGGNVARAWADSVNASGGIGGHQVQLMFQDDTSNPGTSVTAANTLISDHVDVILDLTVLDVVWANTVQNSGIPVVGGNFTAQPYYTSPDFYASGQTNDSVAFSVADTAKKAGATSIAQLYCAEAPQCQQSVPLIKTAAQKLGMTDSYNASISATAPNYTAQCVAAQQAHATALFIGDAPAVIARVGQDCSAQGYNPIYITEGTGYNSQQASAPGLRDHLWSPFPVLPYYVNSAPVQAMNAAVDRYYPGLRNNTSIWSEYAAQSWTGGLLIQAGLKAAGLGPSGTPSAAELTRGLNSLKGETLGGWSPPLTFTAGKPHPVDCWFTGRVQGGNPSLVNGGKLTCQSSSAS